MHFWKSEFIEICDFEHVNFWIKCVFLCVENHACFSFLSTLLIDQKNLIFWLTCALEVEDPRSAASLSKVVVPEGRGFTFWAMICKKYWKLTWMTFLQKTSKILKSWGKMIIRFEKVFIEKLICEIFLLILKIFHEKFAKKSAKRDFQSFLCL